LARSVSGAADVDDAAQKVNFLALQPAELARA
jgi:hypothetical protein